MAHDMMLPIDKVASGGKYPDLEGFSLHSGLLKVKFIVNFRI
jgi:hypothetical protein